MSIRHKTILIALLTLLVLFAILYNTAHVILLDGFTRLETDSVHDNIERTQNTIRDSFDNLSSTTADWSHWDDTYLFVMGENDAYIEGNLMDDSAINLGLNLMVFVDDTGETVFKKALDLQTEQETTFPDGLERLLLQNIGLLDPENLTDQVTGFVQSPDGIIMVAMRHILDSWAEGPIAGTLIFGRYLDEVQIDALSDSLRLTLSSHPVDGEDLSNELRTVVDDLLVGETIVSQPLDANTVVGYTLIRDLAGDPIRILQLEMPREIYAQGQTSLRYFLISLVIIGAVFTLAILLLNDRVVLSRLTRLSETVIRIRDTGDINTRVPSTGSDEISSLGIYINSMLSRLAETRTALQKAHDNLEDEVAARTNELQQEVIMRKQAQDELLQARDQALAALHLKTQILANMSHDARTPLAAISLRTEMMQRGIYGPITEIQQEKLEGILVNTRQLLSFIENVLTASQIDSDKLTLRAVEIAPAKLLEPLEETIKPLADRKGLQLSWAVAEDTPSSVTTDPTYFSQILMNLTDNAIKFTEQGSIQVRIYQADGVHWALEVADTGIGIASKDRERIFDTFWQVDGSITRTANRGVGLGLSIVKRLSKLMGAEIRMQSECDKGTTFTVIFSMAEPVGEYANDYPERAGS